MTLLTGPSQGTPDTFIGMAQARQSRRPDDVANYIREVYRLSAEANIPAHIVVCQSIHETDWWRSFWWEQRCNPAGIGITGDREQDAVSSNFGDGVTAARAHLVHLALYIFGTSLPTALQPHQELDPRWQAAIDAGFAGVARELSNLTGTWAKDAVEPDDPRTYDEKIDALLQALEFSEETPTMANHRYILSAGHRNTDRGGARGEFDWTYPSCKALKEAIEARGGQAWIVQEEDGDNEPSFFRNGGLQRAARTCVTLADAHGPFDAYISSHYNGGNSPGFHAIHPDGWDDGDTKADNPRDVQLCRAIRDRVKATNTVAMIGWTRDSPGVMSEHETGVVSGQRGLRLGEMVGTKGFRNTTARVIIEAGSIDVARERAFIDDMNWVRHVYAEAVVDALADVFGPFKQQKPEPPEDFAPPDPRPLLTQFRDRDEVSIPATIEDNGRWYFWIGREVTVTKQTRRMQFADDNAPSVGPDLMPASANDPADKFFAAWGSIADNGKPFTHTFWNTRVWLEDTDFGVLQ